MQKLLEPLFKDSLASWRKKSWDRFIELGWPKRGDEPFQYVSLAKLSLPAAAEAPVVGPSNQAPNQLVFVDGFFSPSFSSVSSSLICLPLEQAARSYALFLQNRFNSLLKEETDPFAALNGAFQGNGVFLYVPPRVRCEEPLEIVHLVSKEQNLASPRIHISLAREAKLQIIQRGESHFSNHFIDIVLDAGADLIFVDFHESKQKTQAVRSTLKRDSRFKWVQMTKESLLSRTSMKVQLIEENANAEILGLFRLREEREAHIHALVEHKAPHTRSRQHIKTVLYDRAKSSFEGKIWVHPIAQKTESYQLNNNLLLSGEASANTKPNLEIFADDVKASHGATVTKLDEEQLFYLTSRGIPLSEAEDWLVEGFCREITDA